MPDPDRALSEVPALLEERRRYEAWLDALEAKRESTPQHVFERVQADYRSRLERVQERLAVHRNALAEERSNLESRLSLVEAEEKMRRDEHAELELRLLVGELSDKDAGDAVRTLNDTLKQLSSERESMRAKLDALGQLGDAKGPVAAKGAPTPAASKPAAAAPAKSKKGQAPETPGGSFDELAFLSSVVKATPASVPPAAGAPAAPVPPATPATAANPQVIEGEGTSLLSGLPQARGEAPEGEPPLAANVAANSPIYLRTSGALEQSKSLKCAECGAMNYPTEWYCERCGAELAAL
jgi:hypothetical protein